MRTAAIAVAIAIALVAPVALRAQTPPGALDTRKLEQPTLPASTLPLELVKAKPNNVLGTIAYERAGLTPREYRVAGSAAAVSGATWNPFREGSVTTRVVNGRTVYSGLLDNVGALGASCGSRSVWVRAWVQFRAADATGKLHLSNIRGDSTCAMIPG